MKKRIGAIIAVLCLCVTLLPTPAHALTQSEAIAWLRAQVGYEHCDVDGNDKWCTDMATAYINYCWLRANGDGRDPWGLYPYTTKYANQYDEYLSGNPNWTIFPRTASTVPQPGDIFVSNQDYYGNGWGHVGIVLTPHGTTGAEIIHMRGDGTNPRIETVTWGGTSYGAEQFIRFNFFSDGPAPTPVEPTITFGPWEQSGYTYIGETDASIGQAIRISTGENPADSGMYLYDANGNHIATGRNGQLSKWVNYVYFKINEECGYTLRPGTTYQYRFYVVVGGKTYWSDMGSFRTSGSSAPAAPSVTFGPWEQSGYTYIGETDASIGQAITISNGENPADSGMYLYDANGNHIATGRNGQLSKWWGYVYFKINEECGYTLNPGTTYKYKFYAVVDGKTYWSDEGSFKTNGATAVTGVSLNRQSLTVNAGESASLTYAVSPSDAADQTIRVSSSDRSVANVSVSGSTIQVSAQSAGTACITVTTTDGGYTATCTVTVTETGFRDVDKNAWYYSAVKFVTDRGIMSGYNSGLFGPEDNLSRAMVVQVLYNAAGKPEVSQASPFKDVPTGQWFTDAVCWSAKKNIISGFGNGKFKPNDSLTVEQLAVILYNYSGAPAVSGSPSGVGQYSSWAANGLRWAQNQGILSGVPFGNATEPATRAQTAQALMNFLQ